MSGIHVDCGRSRIDARGLDEMGKSVEGLALDAAKQRRRPTTTAGRARTSSTSSAGRRERQLKTCDRNEHPSLAHLLVSDGSHTASKSMKGRVMLKNVFVSSLLGLLIQFAPPVNATLQTDITAACSAGGTVTAPPAVTITTPLLLECGNGTTPVSLVGSPSVVTCQTGAAACITVGSTNSSPRFNLSMKNLIINGPGRTTAGSEGVRVISTADSSTFENIKVDGFDVGIHVVAPVTDLLSDVFFTTLRIGQGTNANFPTVNTSLHLDGFVANVHVTNFQFSGQQHVILFDGDSGNGSGASFTEGALNTTKTPGTAAVDVSSSDGGQRLLTLSQIQDWETSVPYLEMGNATSVILDNVGITGDPNQTSAYPAFHIASNAFAVLTIANSHLSAQTSGANLMRLEANGSIVKIVNSRISGVLNFVTAMHVSLTGNWCEYAPTGSLTNLESAANIGLCP